MIISVIIPCFNECSTISKILDKVLENKNFNYEIIVVDDFSTDGTREILKKIVSGLSFIIFLKTVDK